LIEKARSGESWKIRQGGDQLNDAVYVGDVGRAIYLALKAPMPQQWTFNIGTGRASTPREFLNAAAKLFLTTKSSWVPVRASSAGTSRATASSIFRPRKKI
jgi:nucleoside-diphosphate-sugar epimerase